VRQRANSLVIVLLALSSLIGFTSAIGAEDISGFTSGAAGTSPGQSDTLSSGLGPAGTDGSAGTDGPAGTDGTSAGSTGVGGTGPADSDGEASPAGATGDLPPVRIAYLVPDTTGGTAFGFAGAESDGSAEEREFRALIDMVNARGGIGGRQIEARAFRISVDEKIDETLLVQRCVEIAEDYGASYVIDTQTMIYPSTLQCFAQRGVVLITWAMGASDEFLRQVAPFVATTAPTIDRMFEAMVPHLKAVGYLRDATVGVFLNADSFVDGPYERILKPALERAGARPVAVARAEDFDQAAIGNAILRFRSEGVTHVIFVGHIFQITSFTNAAEAQGYRPRYAFPDYYTANRSAASAPAAQVRGAVAVSAFYDVVTEDASRLADDLSTPFDRGTVRPGLRRCLDTLSEARQTDYYRPGQAGASGAFTEICDHFLLWLDAMAAAGTKVDPASFGAGLRSLGTGYQSPRIHATGFGDGIQAGATHFAAGVYDPNCQCYPRKTPWSAP